MRFELSETQQLLKNSAREFFSTECPPAEVRRIMETETAFDGRLWRKMAEQGWLGLLAGEDYSGQGLGPVELTAAMEEMGRVLLPGPFLSSSVLAGSLLAAAGSAQQKRDYLEPLGSGAARATLAFMEKSGNWAPASFAMAAETTGNGFHLTGRKYFVPDASAADFLICAARLESEPALFIVDCRRDGLRIVPQPALDSTRRLAEVAFDHVEVSADSLLARGEAAREALAASLDIATLAVTAEMVGVMQKVLDMAVDYAKTRKQFGHPIGQFQAIQHYCADMLLWTESSRSAVYYAAWALEQKIPGASLAVSVAKTYASDACREVGNRGIQIHGGMGFTWENDLHLYYRRAKASEIAFGDATYHRERIARLVFDHRD